MSEDIELLKYLYSNMKMNKYLLQKILKKKDVEDEVYNFIKNSIAFYNKFILSISRMLKTRLKRYNEEPNILLDIATSINANSNKLDTSQSYILILKEMIKVNIMDIKRVKEEYKIKSKTILRLIDRIEEFEETNLEYIIKMIE